MQEDASACVVPGETSTDTSITLSTSAGAVAYKKTVALRGNFDVSGSPGVYPKGGRTVHLERAALGTDNFGRFAVATTAADSSYSYEHAPEKGYRYRAVFEGEPATADPSTSAVETVGVRALVTNATSTRKVKLRRSKVIVGSVAPAHAGKAVKITVLGGGRTKTLSDRLDANSRFKSTYRPSKKGMYTVRVFFAGDSDHMAATGNTKKFRVYGKRR